MRFSESSLAEQSFYSTPDFDGRKRERPEEGVTREGGLSLSSGFDVFAGETDSSLTLQNPVPVVAGQFWTMPALGLIVGAAATAEQKPDHYIRRNRTR